MLNERGVEIVKFLPVPFSLYQRCIQPGSSENSSSGWEGWLYGRYEYCRLLHQRTAGLVWRDMHVRIERACRRISAESLSAYLEQGNRTAYRWKRMFPSG